VPSILRSVIAVVVGFVVIGALAFGTGALAARMWPGAVDVDGNPATSAARVAQLLYVGVFAVFGCWLAGRLAPSRPMAHALAVGVLGLILNVASAWATRDSFPAWYLAAGVVTTMLWAWIGGRLAERSGAAPARALA
jgi:hypothetical protein